MTFYLSILKKKKRTRESGLVSQVVLMRVVETEEKTWVASPRLVRKPNQLLLHVLLSLFPTYVFRFIKSKVKEMRSNICDGRSYGERGESGLLLSCRLLLRTAASATPCLGDGLSHQSIHGVSPFSLLSPLSLTSLYLLLHLFLHFNLSWNLDDRLTHYISSWTKNYSIHMMV